MFMIAAIRDLVYDCGDDMTANYFGYQAVRPMSVVLDKMTTDLRHQILKLSTVLSDDAVLHSVFEFPQIIQNSKKVDKNLQVSKVAKMDTKVDEKGEVYDYLLHHEIEAKYIKPEVKEPPKDIKEALLGSLDEKYVNPYSSFFGILYDWHKSSDRPQSVKLGHQQQASTSNNYMMFYVNNWVYEAENEEKFKRRRRMVACCFCSCICLLILLIIVLILAIAGVFATQTSSVSRIPEGPETIWAPEAVTVQWNALEYKAQFS